MFYDEIGEDYNDVQDNSWRGTGKKGYFHFCQSKYYKELWFLGCAYVSAASRILSSIIITKVCIP